MIRTDIEQAIGKALAALGAEGTVFSVEHPPAGTGADYATNAALAAGKALGKDPRELAEALCAELRKAVTYAERIEAAGPGFVNIALGRDFFVRAVAEARAAGDRWGNNESRKGAKIMVEHTQPNPFKPLHIGHLMSNTFGESITRLMKCSGAEVVAVNYQGDIGLHIAKGVWGLWRGHGNPDRIEDIGEAYRKGNAAYEEDPTAKHEIDAINTALYDGSNESFNELRKKGVATSLAHFEELYKLLGSAFDHYFFESEVWKKGIALVEEGLERGIFEKSGEAVVFRGEEAGLHTRVFLTSRGLPTYEAKELGLALAKTEYRPFDLSITTTASEQQDYFKVVFEALGRLRPDLRGKFMHVMHGMMLLPSGKMSSRKGNVVTGEALIEDMRARAREKMYGRDMPNLEHVAGVIGVAAIKYAVLKQTAGKNTIFDEERSLSFEGDSGPYLQYAHTRCVSILKKAKEIGIAPSADVPTPEAHAPERMLAWFPEAVLRASKEYEPHYIAQYLTELAGAFNSWYAKERVLDGTPVASYKLAVVDALRLTFERGLWALGIEAPEEM